MKLTSQEAILKVLTGKSAPSKYALGKALKVNPIMIDHYLGGSRMKQDKADIMLDKFGIIITDVYAPTQDALSRRRDNEDST